MKFQTYIPSIALQPYVKEFVIHEAVDENTYKVLPGTGIVLGFQYKGSLSNLIQSKENKLAASGISGLADHYKVFKNSADIGTVLVIFKEAGATPFFKQPLHEIFRESLSLDNFMLRSELLLLEEKLHEAKTDRARVNVVEQFLLSRMQIHEPDKLVLGALALIHKHQGNIRIADLVTQLHTSQSPLERRFRQAIGTSPKKFASIVRIKSILEKHTPGSSPTELSYEAGFFDQAHFIKEFKTYTGDTPDRFFNKK